MSPKVGTLLINRKTKQEYAIVLIEEHQYIIVAKSGYGAAIVVEKGNLEKTYFIISTNVGKMLYEKNKSF